MNFIIDTFFIGLIVVVFGTIVWYNIVEITKARMRFREHRSPRGLGVDDRRSPAGQDEQERARQREQAKRQPCN